MKNICKHLLVLAVMICCIAGIAVNAQASELLDCGDCGEDLTWDLYTDGTLIISGTGAMTDYAFNFEVPWTRSRSSIRTVYFSDAVTSIGDYAFYNCINLENITIPAHVTTIGEYAFNGCKSLQSVSFPDDLISIGFYAFHSCENLRRITIPDSVKIIDNSAFLSCESLQVATLGKGVTTIGNYAFESCKSLQTIAIPDSVTTIGKCAFRYCNALRRATLGDSVISIGEDAFAYCQVLESINIPDTVTSVGKDAFTICSRLTDVYITDVAAWCKISFANDYANPLCNAGQLYLNNVYVSDLIIPHGVTGIGDYAFAQCGALDRVVIPDSVTSIGQYAFSSCFGLQDITVPDSVTTIGYRAFYLCDKLKTVTIGSGIETIGEAAFDKCTQLGVVTIGGSNTVIDEYAFMDCTGLRSVIFKGNAPDIATFAFYEVRATAYYPAKNTTYTDFVKYDYGGTITWTGYDALKINKQPTTQKVIEGKTAKFSVTASGLNLSYQWQYRTSSSGSWKNVSAASGKTANYSLSAQSRHNGYYYRCRVTDSAGNTVYTKTVRLYVLAIKTQPTTQKVKAGATAKFKVSATGNALKYQWQYKTSSTGSWKNVSAASGKTANYSLSAQSRHNGYYYRCRVTDSAGNTVYTKTVRLFVLAIKTQPVSKTVVAGKTAKFTVSATGNALKFQWYYRTSSSGSWKAVSAASGKTANYSLSAQSRHNGYQYRCKITDSAGNVIYTNVVKLTVKK